MYFINLDGFRLIFMNFDGFAGWPGLGGLAGRVRGPRWAGWQTAGNEVVFQISR